MRKKVIIGLVPLWDEKKESIWMLPGYGEGIMEVGGVPLMLPLTENMEIVKRAASVCDGILFTGGQDVNPHIYGEERIPECGGECAVRDSMEKNLLKIFLAQDKAVFGICRGIQFINAVLGGTLYQDLPAQRNSELEHHQKPPYDQPVHYVKLVEDTPLYELLGQREIGVNSYHHQGIKKLAEPLLPMAYAPDGLIEAVYMPDKKFVWALQWHPEFSYKKDGNSRKILRRFVEEAAVTVQPRTLHLLQSP